MRTSKVNIDQACWHWWPRSGEVSAWSYDLTASLTHQPPASQTEYFIKFTIIYSLTTAQKCILSSLRWFYKIVTLLDYVQTIVIECVLVVEVQAEVDIGGS